MISIDIDKKNHVGFFKSPEVAARVGLASAELSSLHEVVKFLVPLP
jgi:hypothetical protein